MFDFRSPLMIGAGGLIVGCWVGVHVALLALVGGDAARWALFGALLGVFHTLEFLATALLRPNEANFNSYCILHSVPYWAAMAVAAAEYFVSRALWPVGSTLGDALRSPITLGIGALLCAGGLVLRYWAMWVARANFNHLVQRDKPDGHRLVTHGPYSVSRHPSYVGWMVWAVGSQVLLGNVLAVPIFFAASVLFFRHRVALEEDALLAWYKGEYVEYASRVSSLLPFVPGSSMVRACVKEAASKGS